MENIKIYTNKTYYTILDIGDDKCELIEIKLLDSNKKNIYYKEFKSLSVANFITSYNQIFRILVMYDILFENKPPEWFIYLNESDRLNYYNHVIYNNIDVESLNTTYFSRLDTQYKRKYNLKNIINNI